MADVCRLLLQDQRKEERLRAGPGARGFRELVTLCQLPFVLNAEAKARIMQGEALLIKQHHVQSSAIQVRRSTACCCCASDTPASLSCLAAGAEALHLKWLLAAHGCKLDCPG